MSKLVKNYFCIYNAKLVMLFVSYLGALIAAMLNALSSINERLATEKPAAKKLFSHSFTYAMAKNRLFIYGFVLQVLAFFAQAIALNNGPLIVVEPLLTSDLIFLLLFIGIKLHIKIKLRDWLSVLAIMGGLTGLYLATNPTEGHLNYQATPWIILVSVTTPIVITLAIIIRKLKSPKIRAILAAIGAATAFALNAAFTKLSLNLFTKYGIEAMFTSWPLYALIISGVISLYLMLNAYGSGPLAISQPIMEIIEPSVAVIIGVFIFGDSYNSSTSTLVAGLVCVVLLVSGIISLGSSPRIHEAEEQGI